MEMKIMVGLILLSCGVLFIAGCTQLNLGGSPAANNSSSPGSLPGQVGTGQQTAQTQGASGNGQVLLTVSDAATDMGTVTSINVTVDSVMVHGVSSGWITVSSTPQTFDLIALKAAGVQSFLANTNLTPGEYNQIRLGVSEVMVTDSNGSHIAKLPSGDLILVGRYNVSANSTTSINLDFLADRSIHFTGNGKYIMSPVIRLLERNGVDVDFRNRRDVRITGGRVHTDMEIGMNENGSMGEGMNIPSDANVTVGDDGRVHIGMGSMGVPRFNN